MGRTIGTDIARPVQRESHRQALDRDVMDDLIIGTLEECGINRHEGPHPFRRHASGEGHAVLFRNADIKRAFRKTLPNLIQACARRHGGSH